MKSITEKKLKKFNIKKITRAELISKHLKYHELDREYFSDNSYRMVPVEKSLNELIDRNREFWLEEADPNLPLLVVFHKTLTEKEKNKLRKQYPSLTQNENNLFFDYESFQIKYYCNTPCSIVFYPACNIYQSTYDRSKIYFMANGEEIEIPRKEIEKVLLVSLK